ncbi:MAG TPA: hypothetical protein VN408_26975 [Actinoplanes sp.]|nr:hypothetical protein [Actinoplanes sp.]
MTVLDVDRGVSMWRLTAAALATGVVGGTCTAGLALIMGGADVVPAAAFLAYVVPVLLVALIGWRLVAGSAPPVRWIAGATAAGTLLITAVQVLPHLDFRPGDAGQIGEAATAAVIYGSLYGLIAAGGAIVILVPIVLAVRTAIPWSAVRMLITLAVMIGTGMFAFLVTGALGDPAPTGMAVALAGAGAVLACSRTGLPAPRIPADGPPER